MFLQKYELLLVSKLNWDLLAVTGFDFIDHILQRIKWSRHNDMIRRHSLILLHLCYTGKLKVSFYLKFSSVLCYNLSKNTYLAKTALFLFSK